MKTHNLNLTDNITISNQPAIPLRLHVQKTIEAYLDHFDNHSHDQLYNLVFKEVEIGLLTSIMQYTKGNQYKAAKILGIARGTLIKKLKSYALLCID